jgi:MoaA/NifB/PqqE/SkfB family radical SAM enzyme
LKPSTRFTWIIHYSCNYRCPYCFYYEGAGWEILKERNVYLSLKEWLSHWARVHEKYGRCVIIVTGGEPFTYPNFVELISRLSELHYPINITSNSSGDLDAFVREVDPQRVSLSLSFHPAFVNLNVFLERLRLLRENGFQGCINFLAWPPYLRDLPGYRERFNSVGETLKVIPFRGIYREMAYPWSYTEKELSVMGIDNGWFEGIRKRGNLCPAGKTTALLLPEGLVVRCGQIFYRFVVGNFFDPSFELLKEALPCEVEICPCEEDVVWPGPETAMERTDERNR